MKLLLTNDDGIDAPGLAALARAVAHLGHLIVVAPAEHHSGCGHRSTTHRPLELSQTGPDRYALDGTPVDCTRVALAHLMPDVDWVLAGINEGGNLGADVYPSGTVAAAREAVLLGKPGIAISQYRTSRHPVDWPRATRWTREVVEQLFERGVEPGRLWNVNLPDLGADGEQNGELPPVRFCELDLNPLPVRFELDSGRLHYRARYQERLRHAGRDVELCFAGAITVTELRF